MSLSIFLFIIIFLIGLYFYAKNADPKHLEGLTGNNDNSSKPRCPNMLIQKGAGCYLYNSSLAKVPGVNPIEFDNLEDYAEFLNWQKSQNIRCPVLYLQESYNAQGKPCYVVRPGVSEPQGGLPPCTPKNPNPTLLVDATRNDAPYNKNSYPAYDATNQDIGATTPLDAMNQQQQGLLFSPNAMDPNWGGSKYTQSLIDKGFYKENEVSIAVA